MGEFSVFLAITAALLILVPISLILDSIRVYNEISKARREEQEKREALLGLIGKKD